MLVCPAATAGRGLNPWVNPKPLELSNLICSSTNACCYMLEAASRRHVNFLTRFWRQVLVCPAAPKTRGLKPWGNPKP